MCLGFALLAIILLSAVIKLSVSSECAISRCTALVSKQVNRQPYRFTIDLLSLTKIIHTSVVKGWGESLKSALRQACHQGRIWFGVVFSTKMARFDYFLENRSNTVASTLE